MADFDSADLLARVKRYARQPTVTEWPADTDWYAWLTEAEAKWKPILAAHLPGAMYTGPTELTSGDGGLTYDFPNNVHPLSFLVLRHLKGEPLLPGAYHDTEADYVNEGVRIRMTRGVARTFTNGPVLYYVKPAAAINGSTQSTIKPDPYRIVLVFDALERFASAGGGINSPDYWRGMLQKELFGDPEIPGDVGILGRAKLQDQNAGYAADGTWRTRRWYEPA